MEETEPGHPRVSQRAPVPEGSWQAFSPRLREGLPYGLGVSRNACSFPLWSPKPTIWHRWLTPAVSCNTHPN